MFIIFKFNILYKEFNIKDIYFIIFFILVYIKLKLKVFSNQDFKKVKVIILEILFQKVINFIYI